MPNSGATYSSEYLSIEQMSAALNALQGVLENLFGDCELIASYGWGANLHGDLWYKPMKIYRGTLRFFLEDSIEQKIVVPGESDLYINSPNGELKLLFCHESDIHVDGTSEELMKRFMAAEPFSGFRFFSREELKQSYPDHNGPEKSPEAL
jgi:hypothetical protein